MSIWREEKEMKICLYNHHLKRKKYHWNNRNEGENMKIQKWKCLKWKYWKESVYRKAVKSWRKQCEQRSSREERETCYMPSNVSSACGNNNGWYISYSQSERSLWEREGSYSDYSGIWWLREKYYWPVSEGLCKPVLFWLLCAVSDLCCWREEENRETKKRLKYMASYNESTMPKPYTARYLTEESWRASATPATPLAGAEEYGFYDAWLAFASWRLACRSESCWRGFWRRLPAYWLLRETLKRNGPPVEERNTATERHGENTYWDQTLTVTAEAHLRGGAEASSASPASNCGLKTRSSAWRPRNGGATCAGWLAKSCGCGASATAKKLHSENLAAWRLQSGGNWRGGERRVSPAASASGCSCGWRMCGCPSPTCGCLVWSRNFLLGYMIQWSYWLMLMKKMMLNVVPSDWKVMRAMSIILDNGRGCIHSSEKCTSYGEMARRLIAGWNRWSYSFKLFWRSWRLEEMAVFEVNQCISKQSIFVCEEENGCTWRNADICDGRENGCRRRRRL